MDKELLLQANVDYENGIRRFAGNEALYERYLLKFKEDGHYAGAKAAFEAQDEETLLKEAHTLKGVAGTLGLSELYHACADVVTALRSQQKEALPVLFERVTVSYEKVMKLL